MNHTYDLPSARANPTRRWSGTHRAVEFRRGADGDEWADLVDPAVVAAWERGAARRSRVKLIGCLAVLGAIASLVMITNTPSARSAVIEWASMGQMQPAGSPASAALPGGPGD
jgi:hypothetical protein